jgi:hypothetical protein
MCLDPDTAEECQKCSFGTDPGTEVNYCVCPQRPIREAERRVLEAAMRAYHNHLRHQEVAEGGDADALEAAYCACQQSSDELCRTCAALEEARG